jgi:hypothetical protein
MAEPKLSSSKDASNGFSVGDKLAIQPSSMSGSHHFFGLVKKISPAGTLFVQHVETIHTNKFNSGTESNSNVAPDWEAKEASPLIKYRPKKDLVDDGGYSRSGRLYWIGQFCSDFTYTSTSYW